MTERDELAEIIQDCGEYIPGSHADDYVSPDKAADAILAAGYGKKAAAWGDAMQYAYEEGYFTRPQLEALQASNPHGSTT